MLKACSENVFLYNGKVYKQVDGLSMGSPLAPILANWFVSKFETTLLKDSTIKQPKFYRRYVDDIFAVFESEEDLEVFYNLLNNSHDNLTFTIERMNMTTKSLPFLDVNISVGQSDRLETSVFRKPTNTNVLLNYDAMAPISWKRGIVQCFLKRASKICSSKIAYEDEIENLKRIFKANSYPASFVQRILDNNIRAADGERATNPILPEKNISAEEYLVLPYVGKASEKLHKRVRRELLQHEIMIRAAYRTTKVGSYLGLKQKVPALFKADVVYEYKCPHEENTRYVGETQRQLFRRVSEHCSTDSSAVHDHINRCSGCSRDENIVNCFSIIRCSNSSDILSEEALYIKKLEPSLNVQLGPYKGARVSTSIF